MKNSSIQKDWLFSDENSICHFRTVGVLIKNNKILVQREKDGIEYALPGGHVKIGETSENALIREFKEETGTDILCERLLWVEEVFWKWGDKNAHCIAFYYLISLKNDSDIPDDYIVNYDLNHCLSDNSQLTFESHKDNCNVLLEWITIDKVKQLTIYPSFIKDKLENIPENTEHFINFE